MSVQKPNSVCLYKSLGPEGKSCAVVYLDLSLLVRSALESLILGSTRFCKSEYINEEVEA